MMKKLNTKVGGAVAVAAALFITAAPMTAFAQTPDNTETDEEIVCTCDEKCTEDCVNEDCPVCALDYTQCEGADSESSDAASESMGPLTPDGNLTLVDDYGTLEAGGKQFITVVTKSGNYFYIIIDRDDEGDETVHFLNMVDESDLLALMDDEEAQEYISSITAEDTEVEDTTEEIAEDTEDDTEVADETDTGKNKGGLILLIVIVLGGAGYGAYYFMKNGNKFSKAKVVPDPDADYIDSENVYTDIPNEVESDDESETDASEPTETNENE